MEGNSVDYTNNKKAPMRATLCDLRIWIIIYWDKDVGGLS